MARRRPRRCPNSPLVPEVWRSLPKDQYGWCERPDHCYAGDGPPCIDWLLGRDGAVQEPSHVCLACGEFSLGYLTYTCADGAITPCAIPPPPGTSPRPGFLLSREMGDTRLRVMGFYTQDPDVGMLWAFTETHFLGPVTEAACVEAKRVQAWFNRVLLGRPIGGRPVGTRTYTPEEFRSAFTATVRAHPDAEAALIASELSCSERTLRDYCQRCFGKSYREAKADALRRE